jgi:hypothetical protein
MWDRALHEKLIVAELVKEFSAFRGTYTLPCMDNVVHILSQMNPITSVRGVVSIGYRELFPRGKVVGGASLPLPFSFEIKNAWSYTFAFPYVVMVHRNNFAFTAYKCLLFVQELTSFVSPHLIL